MINLDFLTLQDLMYLPSVPFLLIICVVVVGGGGGGVGVGDAGRGFQGSLSWDLLRWMSITFSQRQVSYDIYT
jgi:hypothetical protein